MPETVAADVLLLIQVPPGDVLVSVVVAVGQIAAVPPDNVPALAPSVTAMTLVAVAVPQEFVTA